MYNVEKQFANWHHGAAVRSAPRRALSQDEAGFFFSPRQIPILRHPLVRALGEPARSQIMANQLYRYLDFTVKLEVEVVNRVVADLAGNASGLDLPPAMVIAAYKIYCDEAYHALFSTDMMQQVAGLADIVIHEQTAKPYFLRRLRDLQLLAGSAGDRSLIELFFVIVSETLISGILADVPGAADVKRSVRELVRDHAVDEGRHHAYFAELLRRVWPQLEARQRRSAALVLPELIGAFLKPDLASLHVELSAYGLGFDDIKRVLAETYTTESVGAHIRASTVHLVRYLEEIDILSDPEIRAHFQRAGVVSERPALALAG